jgi:hypothetical protein
MDERPHKAYALIVAAYLGLMGAVADRVRRDPTLLQEAPGTRDLFLLGLGSYQLSRFLTYDKVTSVFRLPFVEEGKGPVHPEGTREVAKGSGLRLAIGQLLTCSLCMSAWTGALNAYLFTLSPRLGRLFLLVLSASGISQMLHPLFELLSKSPGAVEAIEQGKKSEQGGDCRPAGDTLSPVTL